jgi:hypothetical protein
VNIAIARITPRCFMELRMKCLKCGKEAVTDQPEGETSAWFKCECGYGFGMMIKMAPFGEAFLYGIEALRRRRYSSACVQFATAFEVFQKRFVEILLQHAGTSPGLAQFLVYDMHLSRSKYSQLARHVLNERLREPDASVRNRAVHFGEVPTEERLRELGEAVLGAIDLWIKAAEKETGPGYDALMDVWLKGKELSREYSDFEAAIYDLRTALILLREQWEEAA